MNIGFLVTEVEDEEVRKLCIGAAKAANDKDVSLCILPGKYIDPEVTDDTEIYQYQYAALYDYATSPDFDALIIDSKRICSKTTILKKEAFLKKFQDKPFLTLTKEENCTSVNIVEGDTSLEQQGYEAVCDIIFYAKNQILPSNAEEQTFDNEQVSESKYMSALSEINYVVFNRKYETEQVYRNLSRVVCKDGILNAGILLYDKKVRNEIKYPWERPAFISIKSVLIDGNELSYEDGNMSLSTDKIFSTFTKSKKKTFIMGNLFVGEYQLGVMISEFDEKNFLSDHFHAITSLITGVSRLSYLEKELAKTAEELYEVQEELARDDSVLDHIGDQDYLTGGLNRRGFFAKAYDYLKENFKDGTFAVVAYVHMDSIKRINEMFGHEEGDKVVKRVAAALEEVFGDSICGRIRGDEFAVIDVAADDGRAEYLREKMSTQKAKLLNEANRYIIHLQYSICEFGHDENLSLREMLKETDESLKRIEGNI